MRDRTLVRLPVAIRLLALLVIVVLLALAILNATRNEPLVLITGLDQAIGVLAGGVAYLSRPRIIGSGERLRIVNFYFAHSLSVFSVTAIDIASGAVTLRNDATIRAAALTTGRSGERRGERLTSWLAEAQRRRPSAPATVTRKARRDLLPLLVGGAVVFAVLAVVTWTLT